MSTYNTQDLRHKFLEYFKSKEHAIIPGAPVVPKEDPTVLFTTAGMHPLVPYLMGRPHPEGKRLADVQVCIRTTDIDDVGDDTHLTCFEMLGNWSLGDYFKEDAIAMAWEFLTAKEWLAVDPQKIAVTCFEGDETAPQDTESAQVWLKLGIPNERIFFYGRDDNWWGPVGQTGPCGPDTEVFYWTGSGDVDEAIAAGSEPAKDPRWVEIWNNVFMQFDKRDDGTYSELEQKNVDTGMGLERTVAILNGQSSVFETDAFSEIVAKILQLSTAEKVADNQNSIRIIADHLRAAVFIAAAGIIPSNLDQGYVLRRLIRRAIRHGRKLGIEKDLVKEVSSSIIEHFKDAYPALGFEQENILKVLQDEEAKFSRTVEQGLREFAKIADKLTNQEVDGKTAFRLYDTYGFPLEMTQELADEKGLIVDIDGFNEAFKEHQEKSRTATKGTFASGLQDDSEQTIKLHTATHLLHQALRQVLGDQVQQKGSNITPERLRFDFSYPEKLTNEQKQQIEDLVNEQIAADLPVKVEEMSPGEAKEQGALGFFGEKYGDVVTVYSVGDFSKEICTGPHIEHTGQIGTFKIKKEESASAGIRRIKAIIE